MNEVRHHQPNQRAATGNKAARRQVRAIVQVLYALQNLRPCLLRNIRTIPERFRNCDDGDAELFGDVFQPDDHTVSVYNPMAPAGNLKFAGALRNSIFPRA